MSGVSSRNIWLATWWLGSFAVATGALSCATDVILGEHVVAATSSPETQPDVTHPEVTLPDETLPGAPATTSGVEDAVTSHGEPTASAPSHVETTEEVETSAEASTTLATETNDSSRQDSSYHPPGGTWFFEHKDRFPPYPHYPPYPPGFGGAFDGGVPSEPPPWEPPRATDDSSW